MSVIDGSAIFHVARLTMEQQPAWSVWLLAVCTWLELKADLHTGNMIAVRGRSVETLAVTCVLVLPQKLAFGPNYWHQMLSVPASLAQGQLETARWRGAEKRSNALRT